MPVEGIDVSIPDGADRRVFDDARNNDLIQYGPLTSAGERVLSEIERAVQDGRLDLSEDDLRLCGCAVQTLADFGELLAVGAAGEPGGLEVLRGRLLGRPGLQFWRDLEVFAGRKPIGPIYDGPCGVGGIDLGAVIWTDIHLGGGLPDPRMREGGWSDRALAEFGAVAGPLNGVLDAGGAWLETGDPGALRRAIGGLRGIGRDGRKPFSFPCLDEQQMCLGELLNFQWGHLHGPSFPPLQALTPTDVCVGYTGLLQLTPQGTFPPADQAGGVFPTIDRHGADVVSWTPSSILLRLPPGLAPGCHTVGWGFLMDPGPVAELKGLAEQCMPWFPSNGFKSFPLLLWDEPLSFSLIGEAKVSFTANGVQTLAAEACTPVTVAWAVSLPACDQTRAIPQVTMLRDGQPFRPTLSPNGQLVVADADTTTYTLRAVSRVGAQTCATVQRSVTITRQKLLRVAPLLDPCVDTQATVSLNMTVSCPAPAGGIPITVTSDDPAKVAGRTVTLGEGERGTTIDALVGSRCGAVTLTVSAPGHVPAQVRFVVVSAPRIASLTPTSILTCDAVTLTLSGDCLGDPSLPPVGTIVAPSGDLLPATVEVRAAQSEVRLTHSALAAGIYSVALSNCGRASLAPSTLTVSHRPPTITSPLKADETMLQLCATPTVTLRWTVSFATTVRLTRDGTLVAERTYDPCAPSSDSAADKLPVVTTAVNYRLDAINPDGLSVSSALPIMAGSGVPIRSAFAVFNGRTEVMNVFLLSAEDFGGTFLGQLAPGQGVSVSIPSCRFSLIASVVPRLVAEHNANFPNDQFDPTSVNTARTAARGWNGTSSGVRLGQPSAATETITI